MQQNKWPYPNEVGKEERRECDVLVLGGGMAGCYAAIAAARRGKRVILMEKGATERSGAAGSGFDHWESACTNPCSGITSEELTHALIDEQDGYCNGIARYIESEEGWDRLQDMEQFGGKIRDTEGEFEGADFRDPETKLMFAYDYKNRFTLRVWGSTFKPALRRELRRLGVIVCDRTEATALLTKRTASTGTLKGIGAIGMNVHTGRLVVIQSKTTILCMSRPARVWLFDSDQVGLCEFRPTQSIGSGHAMGWRAGMEFTMMEKSVQGEFSAAGRSFPPYSTGNNHNTWYAATMVDARGVEIPYVDRDGNELASVHDRYYPAPGQKFFLKGGIIDNPKYEYRGPETIDFHELMRRGYQLPFYADLSQMPDTERRVIWGMMVGEEGKTKIPVLKSLTDRGFDPLRHRLQSYGTGWQSASFLPQERQLFGAPGGVMHDWNLETNIQGVYAAGDQLYSADCAGFAATTGYYAGRKAAEACPDITIEAPDEAFIKAERERLYAPLAVEEGMNWRELNKAISKAMQNYCGGEKNDMLLLQGINLLDSYARDFVPLLSCRNPHELMRTHEVIDILDVARMILHACIVRKADSKPLCFARTDNDPSKQAEEDCFITIRQENGEVRTRRISKDYYGDVKTEYERHNQHYIANEHQEKATCWATATIQQPLADKQTDRNLQANKPLDAPQRDFEASPVSCSTTPLHFDSARCIGCNRCAAVCQVDIMIPSAEKGRHPVVLYPGECYYCGSCVMACTHDAIRLTHPLMNQTKFVEREKKE